MTKQLGSASQGEVFSSDFFAHVHFTVDLKAHLVSFRISHFWDRYNDHSYPLPQPVLPEYEKGEMEGFCGSVNRPVGCGKWWQTVFVSGMGEQHWAHLFASAADHPCWDEPAHKPAS